MKIEDIAKLAGSTYTLYRCSALFRFISNKREYLHLERIVTKAICERFDLCVEGQELDPNAPPPSGKIYVLKFRPFEIEGFEHDQSYHEQPAIRFELEYQFYSRTRDSVQSMILLPATVVPQVESSKEFWFYPLLLVKLTAPVLDIITKVFEKHFHAYISPLKIPPSMIEYVIQHYAMSCHGPILEEDQYIGNPLKSQRKWSTLRIEYTNPQEEIKTIKFTLQPSQVMKICSLGGSPESFYAIFRAHILKSTQIDLGAFSLNSVTCAILSLSREDKLKIHTLAPKPSVFAILQELIFFASKAPNV